MFKAYLTIDDSPSLRTDDLVDYLDERDIQSLLFCRGDMLEQNPGPVVRAIEHGHLIGNHTYAHKRASERSLEETKDDILKCEALIEASYKKAGTARTHKTFRFSYLDRGAGAWVIDFDKLDEQTKNAAQSVFWEGLNFCDLKRPDNAFFDKQAALQEFLKAEGFRAPFENVTLDWYANSEINTAADCFFTYSTNDWMLTRRHLQKNWPYKKVTDLQIRIDQDAVLADPAGANIILAHDQAEIFVSVCMLVEHLLGSGFEFLDY